MCGVEIDGAEPVFAPLAPAIKGVAATAGDQVYRSMEAASEARAEQMAEIAGGSASDYSHTKITDLNDRQREGDTAYKMPTNEVRQFMAAHPQAPVGSQHAAQAQAYAVAAHTGYMPHAGDRSRQVVTSVHGQIAPRMRQLGQMNKN